DKIGAQDKVITLPRRDRDDAEPKPAAEARVATGVEDRVRTLAGADTSVAKGLMDIVRADPTFEPDGFLKGAKGAYEIIVTAFAEGNRRTLKDLLSREVFDGFAGAISDRESRGELIDQSFVGMKAGDIVEAELKNGSAQV
ncbi:Tim44/TimA family putative adaptor protein, partial [Herbaspirillum sp. HC18]